MDALVTSETDLLNRLNKLDINKSPGPDGLHPRILFEVRNETAKGLNIIFNYSL